MSATKKCDVCGRGPNDPTGDGYATDFFHVEGWPGATSWKGPWDFCSTRCAATHFTVMADQRDKAVARSNFMRPYYAEHNRWLRLSWIRRRFTPEPQEPEFTA